MSPQILSLYTAGFQQHSHDNPSPGPSDPQRGQVIGTICNNHFDSGFIQCVASSPYVNKEKEIEVCITFLSPWSNIQSHM